MDKSREIAIFWDMENFGLSGGMNRNLQRFGKAVMEYVSDQGLAPISELCIAYAHKYRNKRRLPYPHKKIEDIMSQLGFAVRWSECIADIELTNDVQSLINTPYLPQTVVIMSSDTDFCRLVIQSKSHGYDVWVVESTRNGHSLGAVASRQLYLDHLSNRIVSA